MANVPNLAVVREPGKPRKLGRYEIEECLGAESGRETYRARVRGLAGYDRVFAVKCLRRRSGPVTSRSDPFLAAGKRVSSVLDARVARVLDSDIIDGAAVVVTELVSGLDLDRFREWAQSSGELATGTEPAAEKWQRVVAYIGGEIARALASMHALVPPFVHAGLSPRNVILTNRGGVKVLDAGLAAAAEKGGDPGSQRAATYAAPRPAGTDPLPAGDVRALGAMLVELTVGELPAPGATSDSVRGLLEPAWPAMAELIATMLAEDPVQRPRARQVAETLAKHWSPVPEATLVADLAALVRSFSAFVGDSPSVTGVSPVPAAEAPSPSVAGASPAAPPSPAAIAAGSFFAVSDAPTRVSPDGGYAGAIFRALPPDGPGGAGAAPAPSAPSPPAGASLGRIPALRPGTDARPGTLGKSIMPSLPPAPKVPVVPVPRPSAAAASPAATAPVVAPPPAARTVVWSPGPAQALGIAPALLNRTMTASPAPPPVTPRLASPVPASAPMAEELGEPEAMAETADWGAQALAALGTQAGVAVALAPEAGEGETYAAPDGEAPPAISDPALEEAFSFAPQQGMPESWAAPQPVSQGGPPALEARAFAPPAGREMLEDELLDEEPTPLLASSYGGEGQAPDAYEQDALAEAEGEPEAPSSEPLEATAFLADDEGDTGDVPEAPEGALAIPCEQPDLPPAPVVRRAATRSALRSMSDLAEAGTDDELARAPRSRRKRIALVLAAAAVVGAGAAALTLGPLGKKSEPLPAPPKARVAATGPAKAKPVAAAPPAEASATQAGSTTPEAKRSSPPDKPSKRVAAKEGAPAPAAAIAAASRAGATTPPAGAVRVSVESTPPGARAWINGQDRGETPLVVQLPPGSARVVLVRPGHLTSQSTVEVREGAAVEVTLKPVAPPMTGEARFRAECQTTGKLPIVVDGKETGILCPFSKMRVDPGTHTIGLLIPATGQVHQKEVTLRPGVRSIVFGD